MRLVFTFLIIPLAVIISFAQREEVLELYTEIPCENNLTEEIVEKPIGRIISKVRTPTITIFKPEKDELKNGAGVIICPGGGYTVLAFDWEGTSIAKYFNSIGVTAFVLKYRLPHWESEDCRDKVALADAKRAMRLVRKEAKKYNVDPDKIGIMGFSAGGHLASTLSTHFDNGDLKALDPVEQISCRPNFSILMYPVISCDSTFSHKGSCLNLLGKNPASDQIRHFSNETQITTETPATLLIHSADDTAVPVENSIRYYRQLVELGVPAAMHLFPKGGHGFSMGKEGSYESQWPSLCKQWLAQLWQ